MRIINRPRGAGKTVMLINAAAVTGYPIIANTEQKREHILDVAKIMGVADYITVYTAREIPLFKHHEEKILVDEVEQYFSEAIDSYFGTNVVAGTCSIPMIDFPKEEE